MRRGDQTVLDRPANSVGDPHGLILELAKGRHVLNVGAAGNAAFYRDSNRENWLHGRLADAAETALGLDLDADGVAVLVEMGFEAATGNCEDVDLEQRYDLIVMSDVLEHVDNPVRALKNMVRHLNKGGKIVLTTPNATYLGNGLNGLLHRDLGVYWDHVCLYVPENIQAICDRHGWGLSQTSFFSLPDRRSPGVRLKSAVFGFFGRLFPRLHSAFLCVITPRDAGG